MLVYLSKIGLLKEMDCESDEWIVSAACEQKVKLRAWKNLANRFFDSEACIATPCVNIMTPQ